VNPVNCGLADLIFEGHCLIENRLQQLLMLNTENDRSDAYLVTETRKPEIEFLHNLPLEIGFPPQYRAHTAFHYTRLYLVDSLLFALQLPIQGLCFSSANP